MSVTRKYSTKKLRVIGIIFLVVFLVSAMLLFLSIWERNRDNFPEQSENEDSDVAVRYDGKDYVLDDNIETVLIMGLDKFDVDIDDTGYTNDQQADFILLYIINNNDKTCSALQINRDTVAEMNILGVAGEKIGTKTQQIALAHTYGNGNKVSCRNTADAVSKLLFNAKINHYISLTMDAVPVMNDFVDGVEVTVLDDFTGIDDTLVKGESVILKGEHSLNYVRSRYGMDDSTNSNRMVRQRQYLNALLDKMQQKSEQNEHFAAEAILKVSDYMVSDCSVTYLETLFEKISGYSFTEIYTIEGESIVGEKFMEFYPDEDSVAKTVATLLCRPKD